MSTARLFLARTFAIMGIYLYVHIMHTEWYKNWTVL